MRHREKQPFGRRWAPASYKWSYKPYKWPYKWVTGVITLLIGVITPFITSRGPTLKQPFGRRCSKFFQAFYPQVTDPMDPGSPKKSDDERLGCPITTETKRIGHLGSMVHHSQFR